MALINFQKQFANDVMLGKKKQTIRARRKYPIHKGDILHLYTGLRTKQSRLLCVSICSHVAPITITANSISVWDNELTEKQIAEMAVNDGFHNFDELKEWFVKTHGLPFEGDLIEWK